MTKGSECLRKLQHSSTIDLMSGEELKCINRKLKEHRGLLLHYFAVITEYFSVCKLYS